MEPITDAASVRIFLMLCLLLCILLVFVPAPGSAASDAAAIRRGIEARYRGARTLKATFYEQFSSGNGGGVAGSGAVYFSRPGRMRWEYESPEQKLFIVDGTNVWFYVPADRTASRAKIAASSDCEPPWHCSRASPISRSFVAASKLSTAKKMKNRKIGRRMRKIPF